MEQYLLQKVYGFEKCTYEKVKTWTEDDYRECVWRIYSITDVFERIKNGKTINENIDNELNESDSEEDANE